MRTFTPRGATLAELLVALVLLSGLALASAPVAARTAELGARALALANGTALAASRAARSSDLPCTPGTGTDSTARVRLAWQLLPTDSTLLTLIAVIQDAGSRWPPDTVATLLPCLP